MSCGRQVLEVLMEVQRRHASEGWFFLCRLWIQVDTIWYTRIIFRIKICLDFKFWLLILLWTNDYVLCFNSLMLCQLTMVTMLILSCGMVGALLRIEINTGLWCWWAWVRWADALFTSILSHFITNILSQNANRPTTFVYRMLSRVADRKTLLLHLVSGSVLCV